MDSQRKGTSPLFYTPFDPSSERFLAEIKTTANLTHPNVLPLHDSGEADGLLMWSELEAAGKATEVRDIIRELTTVRR